MLADFTIVIHSDPERSVRVVVHNDLKRLRIEATRHSRRWGDKKSTFADTCGICHRFETPDSSLCAIVRLAPPHLGVGVISHELGHAAVWLRELDEGELAPLNCANDEPFCWLLGELVRQTVNKLNEHKMYEKGNMDPNPRDSLVGGPLDDDPLVDEDLDLEIEDEDEILARWEGDDS